MNRGAQIIRKLLPLLILLAAVLLAEGGKNLYKEWKLQPKEAQLILNGETMGQAASIRTEKVPLSQGYRLGETCAVVPTQDILEYWGLQTQWINEEELRISNGAHFVTFHYKGVDLTGTDGETVPCWQSGDYACYRGRRVGRLESDVRILKQIVEELIPDARVTCQIDEKEATVHIDLS